MRLAAFITGLMVVTALTAQRRTALFDDSDMALDLTEAFTYRKYPTYDQYLRMMQTYPERYPELCRLDTFGTSEEGRLLLALKISDNPEEDEPEASFLYTSTIHGKELLGFVLLLRFADTLLSAYKTDPEIANVVDNLAIWINPLANPDGSYSGDNNISLKSSVRENAKGIDLNRDFPDPGMNEADDTTGRARETREMMLFMREQGFTMSANIHSGTEVVNYPWDYTFDLNADDDWYRFVSREYADEARAVDPDYMANWLDGITNGANWFVAHGTRQDYANYYLEGREVTLELYDDFRLSSDLLEEYWGKNHRSLLNYISQCTYGIRGVITDRLTGNPIRARVSIQGHDSAYSVVHSSAAHGDFYRLIKEGVYDLVISAYGYLSDTATAVSVTDYKATFLNVELEQDPFAGVPANRPGLSFSIYPNPSTGDLYVATRDPLSGPVHMRIYSIDGKEHLHRIFTSFDNPVRLSLDHLPGGLYLIHIFSGGIEESFRLIMQQ